MSIRSVDVLLQSVADRVVVDLDAQRVDELLLHLDASMADDREDAAKGGDR